MSCPAHKLLCFVPYLNLSRDSNTLFRYSIFKVLCRSLLTLFLDSSHSILQNFSVVKGFLKNFSKNFSKTPYPPLNKAFVLFSTYYSNFYLSFLSQLPLTPSMSIKLLASKEKKNGGGYISVPASTLCSGLPSKSPLKGDF